MYCRMCGNKISDTDRYCQMCGTPTGLEKQHAAPSEEKEEIVFNPPFENQKSYFAEKELRFAEEKPAETEAEAEEVPSPSEDAGESEPVKNPEFVWNVYDFPKPGRKTEEIEFNWNMEEFSPSKQIETEVPSFEEELFREITDDTDRGKVQNIDRFFTFSKKNEEFQELLDKEYEKFIMHTGPEVPLETAAPATEEPSPIPEATRAETKIFGENLIRDNESIKRKLESPEAKEEPDEEAPDQEEPNPEEPNPGEPDSGQAAAEELTEAEPGEAEKPSGAVEPDETMFMPAMPAFSLDDGKKEKRKWGVGQILLAILAVILIIEIAILGIRYFAPDSGAAKVINSTQTQVFHTVSGWADGIKDLFSGKDANKETETSKNVGGDNKNAGQENGGNAQSGDNTQAVPAAGGQTGAVAASEKPDPSPAADKTELISSQLGNNKNIEQVKASDALTYQSGKHYGSTDINNSKPIENNVWKQSENGEPVYYDRSVVGTVIAFDSQWIDYVNGGDKSVFDLAKKDSEAYRKMAAFSKAGKVKETFKLLEIGEIRQGSKGFYVWAHEEIQVTEKRKTTNQKYNWIYYLEPSEGKMQIVNYFKF